MSTSRGSPKASYITPVPGGVGPMTVVMLLENTLIAAASLEKTRTTIRPLLEASREQHE